MNFIKRLFIKKKKFKCMTCRDMGTIKQAKIIAIMNYYSDGSKTIQYREPQESEFIYKSCPAYCETREENEA